MKIGITGGTGFLGRYIVRHLQQQGHALKAWYRTPESKAGIDSAGIEWLSGELGSDEANSALAGGCDAIVHSALYHPGGSFREESGDLVNFLEKNVIGTVKLIEAAREAGVKRFIFISSCAVHDKILQDRPLDETHPLWAKSHYGAHKGAIEKFVHSYGLGQGYPICSLRPTGIYGLAHPADESKWYPIVRAVKRDRDVTCAAGGKEVHAADVAKAVSILLRADNISGEAYNCYDRYISEHEVATIAKQLSGSKSTIYGDVPKPKNQIDTKKIRALGMEFGGLSLLEATISQLLEVA